MATSISQAQAEALADNFLNQFGSSRNELKPKSSLAALYLLAGATVIRAQNNLNKADRVATGKLNDSLKVLDPRVENGVTIVIDIEAAYYYKFVDAGVRGTKRGSSSKGYSYKNKMPPVNVIRKWVIREGLKGVSDKYTGISNRDDFRKSISARSRERSSTSIAWAIAKSIKQKGLRKTNFLVNAVKDTRREAKDKLAKGFRIDIINSLPKKLGE